MSEQTNRATVMMIRGHGEERLKQAITQGLVQEDLQADYEEVLKQLETVQKELKTTQEALEREKAKNDRFRKIYLDALKSQWREEESKTSMFDIRLIIGLVAMLAVVIAIMCLIVKLILG